VERPDPLTSRAGGIFLAPHTEAIFFSIIACAMIFLVESSNADPIVMLQGNLAVGSAISGHGEGGARLSSTMPKRSRSDSKRTAPQHRGSPAWQSQAGTAGSGADFHAGAQDQTKGLESEAPKAAPALGVPVSDAEYERMKKRAARMRARSSVHAQEDPSAREDTSGEK
jgi:hypothetical protein